MEGWIKLHRKIMDNPLYLSEPFTRMQAWIDLLLLANHKEGFFYVRGNKVVVGRGQVGTSSRTLASRWQWSRGKVERFLKDLENDNQIEPQKNNVITLISICNYDDYQNTEPQTEPQTSHRQTTDRPQTDRNKNDKKEKNEKNEKNYKEEDIFISDEIKIKNEAFEKFNKWVDENATNVRRIKNQITEEQFAKLKEKYNSQQIMQIILNLENYKDAPKKYTSVYLTVNNWLKKDTNNLK